jgi:hypothetical protein
MSLSRAELMQAIVWGAAFAARAREYEGEDSPDKWMAKDAAGEADRALSVFLALPGDRWPFDDRLRLIKRGK